GYIFNLPQIEHKCDPYGSYFTKLKEPQFLGYDYLLLTPYDLGSVFWQTIPLVLIIGLSNGESVPVDATIMGASEAETIYRISNFEKDVIIPDDFARYLKEIGGIDQMVSVGILDEKVADIAKQVLNQSGMEQGSHRFPGGETIGYEKRDLISSLADLGVPVKDAENLLELIPKNSTLREAKKIAMQKYSETIAQQQNRVKEG
ncbi:hypothetical protein ACFLVY_02180, partial [Chloroflexota bacterium]